MWRLRLLLCLCILISLIHTGYSKRSSSLSSGVGRNLSKKSRNRSRNRSSSIDGSGSGSKGKEDPYDWLVDFLTSSVDEEISMRGFSDQRLHGAFTRLASSQAALKLSDGATHRFNSAMTDRKNSLTERYRAFLKRKGVQNSRKSSKSYDKALGKEASKILEYITTVERSLQATEILQATGVIDEKERFERFACAGLKEIGRISLKEQDMEVAVSVLVKTDRRNLSELYVSCFDISPTCTLLGPLSQRPYVVDMIAEGLVREELHIQPCALTLANKLILNLGEFVQPFQNQPVASNGTSDSSSVTAKRTISNKKLSDHRSQKNKINEAGTLKLNSQTLAQESENNQDKEKEIENEKEHKLEPIRPKHIHLVGFGMGGAIASVTGLLLDGTIAAHADMPKLSRGNRNKHSSKSSRKSSSLKSQSQSQTTTSTSTGTGSRKDEDLAGSFQGHVSCISIAPPPTLSRVLVPPFVTTLVGGDDAIPRLSRDSLKTLCSRLLKAIPSKGSSWLSLPGSGTRAIMGDLAGQAALSLKHYTGQKHDLTSLQLPGRVFYLKSRKHANGATLQRVLRGNWREDVLWSLHQVLISPKMLSHHTVDNYINILSRC
jgi:hypothetical protein